MWFNMANIKILEIMPYRAKFTNFSLPFKLKGASILYEAHMHGFKKLKNYVSIRNIGNFN